jgi:hypothetical protein
MSFLELEVNIVRFEDIGAVMVGHGAAHEPANARKSLQNLFLKRPLLPRSASTKSISLCAF